MTNDIHKAMKYEDRNMTTDAHTAKIYEFSSLKKILQ